LQLQEILASYSPWGKPGGGAPCAATLRKKNVPLEPPELPRCHSFGQVKPHGKESVYPRLVISPSIQTIERVSRKLRPDKFDQAIACSSDARYSFPEKFQAYAHAHRADACKMR